MAFANKAGASPKASPAVKTAFTATGSAGSHSAAVSDPRAKLLALFHAFGGKPCLVRWDDGRTAILSAEALRVVDIPLTHGGMNA